MSDKPSVEAIIAAQNWLKENYSHPGGAVTDSLASLLDTHAAKARMEEAKWWHTRVAMIAVAGGDDGHEIRTETRERIAAT